MLVTTLEITVAWKSQWLGNHDVKFKSWQLISTLPAICITIDNEKTSLISFALPRRLDDLPVAIKIMTSGTGYNITMNREQQGQSLLAKDN